MKRIMVVGTSSLTAAITKVLAVESDDIFMVGAEYEPPAREMVYQYADTRPFIVEGKMAPRKAPQGLVEVQPGKFRAKDPYSRY